MMEVMDIKKTVSEARHDIKAISNSRDVSDKPRHINTRNEHLAGKRNECGVLYRNHTFRLRGEKVEGVFPVFDAKDTERLPPNLRRSGDDVQMRYCTERLAKKIELNNDLAKEFTPRQLEQIKNGSPKISNLTWHHNEIPGKMELVDERIHAASGHTGGASLWGGRG